MFIHKTTEPLSACIKYNFACVICYPSGSCKSSPSPRKQHAVIEKSTYIKKLLKHASGCTNHSETIPQQKYMHLVLYLATQVASVEKSRSRYTKHCNSRAPVCISLANKYPHNYHLTFVSFPFYYKAVILCYMRAQNSLQVQSIHKRKCIDFANTKLQEHTRASLRWSI